MCGVQVNRVDGWCRRGAQRGDLSDLVLVRRKRKRKNGKDDKGGDWWLYASTESTTSGKIGYWPKSLFSKLAQNGTVVNYGGFVQVKKGSVSPPMGSGHFPNDTAAFFANVEYVDEFGRKIAGNLPSVVTNKNCYDVGNMGDATFFYGGPGGCVS
ncbi:hypothetical protein LUZ63_008797 [Rhynchospora breviuscula]|uniref:Neprosin PEP catalytic domain-containing protein n=1 Tax=Rhynchospora breviuscula TaxID=2022672 RepID=A0A9Q0HN49_9POAL|nr:hypothetical protein LUZ63_008797 [Rhynchospora breviuscula]